MDVQVLRLVLVNHALAAGVPRDLAFELADDTLRAGSADPGALADEVWARAVHAAEDL